MEPISSAQRNGGTSITTMPTHAAGDLLLISAMRFSSTTIPSLPSGWTPILSDSGSGRGWRVGYKVAASASETSGSWTNATDVNLSVYRGAASVGAVAASTSGVPALTLTAPGVGWVVVQEVDYPEPPTPTGCTLRYRGDWWRFSDTDGPVSSWAAQTTPARTASIAVSVELVPAVTYTDAPVSASWNVEAFMDAPVSASWLIDQLTTDAEVSASWNVEAFTESTVSASWVVESYGTPAELVRTQRWRDAVASRHRTIGARAELVDAAGHPVPVQVGKRAPQWDLPIGAASVEMHGEQAVQYSAVLPFTAAWMAPTTADHPLRGLTGLRVRLWWRILVDGVWLEHPIATLVPEDPEVDDDGLIVGTIRGRDVLATARGGYGTPLDVSGLSIDNAIRAIFERVAPTITLQVAATDVTTPDPCILFDQDPAQDWTELAAIGWPDGVVRSDAWGDVIVGPRAEPAGPVIDWQEGDDCPVSAIRWSLKTSAMGNRQTVISTNPDAVGVYATVEDDDPASPTYVGGSWGPHPLPDITSDLVVTTEACLNLARMHLGKGLRPAEDVEVTVLQRGDLAYQQPVRLGRAALGVGSIYRVSSWSLTLPVARDDPPLMTVRMMQRRGA